MDFDVEAIKNSVMAHIAPWGAKILGVVLTLFVAWIIAGMVRRRIVSVLEGRKFDITLARFFANLARYIILIGAGLGCLGAFGVETTSFAAVIGAAGLAIGLAFQGTLSHFSAGAMLLIFRPFRVGDFIAVAGIRGVVQEIELFTTEFKTPDGRKVIVPNGSIFGSTIENMTSEPTRRVDIDVGTDYGADLQKTREALEAAAGSIEGGLSEPPPQVFLKSLGESAIDWQVRVWVNTPDYWDVWQRAIFAVKKALDDADIGIPFPQMDVHLDKPDAK